MRCARRYRPAAAWNRSTPAREHSSTTLRGCNQLKSPASNRRNESVLEFLHRGKAQKSGSSYDAKALKLRAARRSPTKTHSNRGQNHDRHYHFLRSHPGLRHSRRVRSGSVLRHRACHLCLERLQEISLERDRFLDSPCFFHSPVRCSAAGELARHLDQPDLHGPIARHCCHHRAKLDV